MHMDLDRLRQCTDRLNASKPLTGVITVHVDGTLVFGRADGFADRCSLQPNKLDTRFQVASGCKIFTSVAVSRLIQRGAFSYDTPLRQCLDLELPECHPGVTPHHLLTHTAGIPDYFDEEGGQDFEELWQTRPMYTMRSPSDFVPLFRDQPMKFDPGDRFSYNGAAFILLGLIVEQHSGVSFPRYVESDLFARCGMNDSGYFFLDRLPERTASSYIRDEDSDHWRSNIYAVPIVGGPDGGAFLTAPDMARFWDHLYTYQLLDESITRAMLRPHVAVPGGRPNTSYGYGVWMTQDSQGAPIHYVEGWDPGVAFLSASFPGRRAALTIACNSNYSAWRIFDELSPIIEKV